MSDDDASSVASNEYVVEQIKDYKINRNTFTYLIRWKGYDTDEETWEPEENVIAEDLLEQFWKEHGPKPELVQKKVLQKRRSASDHQRNGHGSAGKRRAIRPRSDDDEEDQEDMSPSAA